MLRPWQEELDGAFKSQADRKQRTMPARSPATAGSLSTAFPSHLRLQPDEKGEAAAIVRSSDGLFLLQHAPAALPLSSASSRLSSASSARHFDQPTPLLRTSASYWRGAEGEKEEETDDMRDEPLTAAAAASADISVSHGLLTPQALLESQGVLADGVSAVLSRPAPAAVHSARPGAGMSALSVDESNTSGCAVQTIRSAVLAAKRGESRVSAAIAAGCSPPHRRAAFSAQAEARAKQELYKTEICRNWSATGRCSYGNKCKYAHGEDDLKDRGRSETYNTKPCTDLARSGSRTCTYGRRCNYAHPGDAIRRVGTGADTPSVLDINGSAAASAASAPDARDGRYLDHEYAAAISVRYPRHHFPFGVFL